MAIPVLVVTSNRGLGELLRQILNETGKFLVSVASKAPEAIQTAEVEQPVLVMVETDLKETPVGDLLTSLREKLPDLVVLLITPEDKTGHASYAGMQPDSIIFKPVYLPDFISKVESVLEKAGLLELAPPVEEPETAPPPAEQSEADQAEAEVEMEPEPEVVEEAEENPSAPPWLNDVNLAAQYLTRLSLESSAQASLISKKDEIWAYAGELPRPAAEELARTVATHFENGGGSDLARFIRLEETGGEYMLYATGMGGEYVLATVFSAETPFSKIRAQASHLAEALASAPLSVEEEEPEESPEEEQEEPVIEDLWPLLEDVPPPIPNDWVPESSLMKQQNKESLLDKLLDGATLDTYSSETVAITKNDLGTSPQRHTVEEMQTSKTDTKTMDPVQQPKAEKQQAALHAESSAAGAVSMADETRPSASKQKPESKKQVPVPESELETRVSKSAQPTLAAPAQPDDQVLVDPVSPSMYNLTYACVLIPRFPQHHLAGEVARWLSDWINDLTVAFGWRLEHLSIRPEYLQFLVNVPPNTSPGYLMRTIRKHTSRRMFVEFPSMEQENPSGDFWAPGYLILGNPQPPPPALVRDFIRNTRKRQGLAD